MSNPNPKTNQLTPFPRLVNVKEACSRKPVQVKIPKTQYSEWMTLPVQVRNKVLREAITEALQNKKSLLKGEQREKVSC
jgi:D-aminopeptidase